MTYDSHCPVCGAGPQYLIPVWEDPTDYHDGNDPDYVGCTECSTMTSADDMPQPA